MNYRNHWYPPRESSVHNSEKPSFTSHLHYPVGRILLTFPSSVRRTSYQFPQSSTQSFPSLLHTQYTAFSPSLSSDRHKLPTKSSLHPLLKIRIPTSRTELTSYPSRPQRQLRPSRDSASKMAKKTLTVEEVAKGLPPKEYGEALPNSSCRI